MNHASRLFWESYARLPSEVRQRADKSYRLFQENPRHPSLQFKRVGKFWSARVSDGYRAVGVDVEDGILWIRIYPHREYEKFIGS